LDLDATETESYGSQKQGAARSHTGALAYNSYVVTRAQRGRALTSELQGGNRSRITAPESAAMIARATKLLPSGHGQVTVRGDSGVYSAELMMELRVQATRFSFSAPRTKRMWSTLSQIPEDGWLTRGGCTARRSTRPCSPRTAGATSSYD
jgi:hypothetical protein